MNAALLRLRGPGVGWLPLVLRQPAYWRTVGRFALWGPLIGGAPYAWALVTLPFVYAIGVVPALLAGLLFAAWYHGSRGATPGLCWRLMAGTGAALAACALVAAALVLAHGGTLTEDAAFLLVVMALHGVPAAMVLAWRHRPTARWTRAPGGAQCA